MSVSDPVADMLVKIKNACQARHESVDVLNSNFKSEIAKILLNEGYIKSFEIVSTGTNKSVIRISLKYDKENKSVIHGVRKISTPGRRVYSGYKELPRVLNGYGTIIVSTSSGIITGKQAKAQMVGGELICSIW